MKRKQNAGFYKRAGTKSNHPDASSNARSYRRGLPISKLLHNTIVRNELLIAVHRKGATPSQIGVVLRDSHGVAQVKVVTGMYMFKHVGIR